MSIMQTLVGGALTMLSYGLLFGGLYKLITISNDLAEIKELLKKRSEGAYPPTEPPVVGAWTVLDSEK